MSDIPKWAFARVSELTGKNKSSMQVFEDFARYIAEHEKPPLEPLLEEARKVLCQWATDTFGPRSPIATNYSRGDNDGDSNSVLALAALKRGMELAERPTLTREMVRDAAHAADVSLMSWDLGCLHAALVERMTQGEG
jgi:hypothetical protein